MAGGYVIGNWGIDMSSDEMLIHVHIGYPSGSGVVFPPEDPGSGLTGAASLSYTREELMTIQGPTARFYLNGNTEFQLDGPLRMWGADDIDSEYGDITNLLFRPVYVSPEGGIKTIHVADYPDPEGWQYIGGNATDGDAASTYYWTSLARLLMHVGVPDSVRVRLEDSLRLGLSPDGVEIQLQQHVNINPFTFTIDPVPFVNAVTSTVINPAPFEFDIVPRVSNVVTSEVIRILGCGVISMSPSGELIVEARALKIDPIIFYHGSGLW